MDHKAILDAFRVIFPHEDVTSYKRIDPHSIEVKTTEYVMIFTYYGPKSWRLETK